MNVYVEPSGRRIQPFDDPVGDSIIQHRPLSAWQADALRDAGLTRVDALQAPCLVIPDTLFTTGAALRVFLDGAAGRDAVLVLGESVFGAAHWHVQPDVSPVDGGWRFDRVRFVSGRDEAPVDVVVDPDEAILELPAPVYMRDLDTIRVGTPRYPFLTLHHWVHILWANELIGGVQFRNTPVWKVVLRGLWAVARAFSINKWRVLGKANIIGKGCDIHPTAVVEGSTIRDGATIGPFAHVLLSDIGEKATVMASAQVNLSVVGERATVSERCVLRFSVLYPGAMSSQYLMQKCVLGRDALTTGAGFSIDLNFENDVRVPLDGKLWTTGTRFLGSAFGHRARIGTGFWLAAGRMVPNDYFLIRDPNQVLDTLDLDLDASAPLVVDGRRLLTLSEWKAATRAATKPKPNGGAEE